MKNFLIVFNINLFLTACSFADSSIQPSLNHEEFFGFNFLKVNPNSVKSLSNYEYQKSDGINIEIKSCMLANNFNISKIAEFDYFRFNLLLLSCKAIDKFSFSTPAKKTFFPSNLAADFFLDLPAQITPLISKADKYQRKNKTLISYDKKTTISIETPRTAKLLTEEDEIYITLLARGDFDGDSIEDLLIKTEWFARNAHGKHADLLIINKKNRDKAVEIYWRLRDIK